MVKNPPSMQEPRVQPLGWQDPLKKEITTHSNILAWEIGRLQSMGWQKSQTIPSNNNSTTKYQTTNSLSYKVHVTKASFYTSLSSR